MVTSKKKIALVVLCAVLLTAILTSVGIIIPNVLAAQNATWSGDDVQQSYAYGSLLTIPKRSITVGDSVIEASHYVVFPDGSSSYGDSVALTKSGMYKLTYTAKANSKVYTQSFDFSVVNALYSVADTDSSATYMPRLANTRYQDTDGVMVKLVKGDALTFNQLISVDDLILNNNFIEGLVYPEGIGASGFSRLVFTLTDVNNPEIFVKIVIGERTIVDDLYGESYVYAGGNGQSMVGVQTDGNGNYQKHFTDDGFGQSIYLPFRGKMSIRMPSPVPNYTYEMYADDYPFRLRFDAQTKEIWHSTNYNNHINSKDYDQSETPTRDNVHCTSTNWEKFVTDLDNPTYYKTLWGGFESDYVRLSVSADKYNAKYAQFAITSVLGMDLSADSFEVTSEPVISIDGEQNLPNAKVGHTYPLTSATAFDVYCGNVEVKTNVYYNYFGENKIAVNMQNGCFDVPYEGYYAIVHTATNHFGVTSQAIQWVWASDEVPEIDIAFGTYDANSKVGLYVPYATAELTGGSGNISVNVYAKHKSSGEILSTKNGFTPEKTGVWEVIYEATDYIGQKQVESYEVNVSDNPIPVLASDIVLPQVFISGGRYVLPEVYANIYSNGAKDSALCKVKITDANGTKEYSAGSEFLPKVNSNGETIKVVYLCNDIELFTQDVLAVVPYATSNLDFGALFVSNDATGNKTEQGYTLIADSNQDTISFLYANAIVADGMEMTLRCFIGTAIYDEIVVTFTDAADSTNAVKATFKQEGDVVKFIVGDKSYSTANSFGLSDFDLQLQYSGNSFVFANLQFPIATTINGEKFEGFKSDKVYISICAKNATCGSKLAVVSIRDYLFKVQVRDVIKPYFVSYDKNGIGVINQNYTILPISVGDVISPSVVVTIKVLDPTGEVVKDINGKDITNAFIENIITTSKIGDYKVMYTITENDDFGVRQFSTNYTLTIRVRDTIAPTVEFTSKYTKTAKVGDTLVMPDFTVSDNESSLDKMIVYVYVINPNGMLQSIDANVVNGKLEVIDRNSIICSTAGVYTFQVMAIDEAGNLTISKVQMTVEEA